MTRLMLQIPFAFVVLLVLSLMSVSSFTPASAKMWGGSHGLGGGSVDKRWVIGNMVVPNPTMDNNSQKDYIMYVTDSLTDFVAASGVMILKTTGTPTKCYLKLYMSDTLPNDNFHYYSCSPQASGTVVARIDQSADDSKTWTGNSNGLTQAWTFTTNGSQNPPYYGAASGSSTNNLNQYSSFSSLKVKDWDTGNLLDFSATDSLFKCKFDTGYKYDQNTLNAFQTGPPTIAVDECTDQVGYGPNGKWP